MGRIEQVDPTKGDQLPNSGDSRKPRTLTAYIRDWLGILLAAISLPYFIAPLGSRVAIGATLIAAAIAATVVAVSTPRPWMRLTATVGLALIVITGGILIVWGPSTWLGLTEQISITMVNPSPGDPSAQPGCLPVSFSGILPAGDTFVVANREEGNTRYFFQGVVIQDPATGNWTSKVQLGKDGKDDGGKLFRIIVYVMNEASASYLTNAVPLNGETNWSSPVPPPGAVLAGGIDVRRDHGNKLCPSGP
jgi:hypothetical protein